jgi:glycine cleavage system regulatory protein
MRVAASSGMQIDLDPNQAEVLRETLQHLLHDLRVESARTDTHDFREMLHRRERVVEAVLAKLPPS